MIHEVPNFIHPDVCQWVIDWFEKHPNQTNDEQDEFFKNRIVQPAIQKDFELRYRFKIFEQMMVQKMSKLYPDDPYIFTEHTNICKWPAGIVPYDTSEYAMDPHRDNEYDRIEDALLVRRDYTTVCYLNDDYEGGHTNFPEYDRECIPETGKVVFLPSSVLHGVTKISGGTRYTIATWFTKNIEAVEQCIYL